MAKAYSAPEGITWEFPKDWHNDYEPSVKKYENELRSWVKKNTDSKSPLVGKIVSTPVADGCAQYMIFRTKPLELIHMDIGDAWHADRVWVRGLRLSDVKQMIEAEERLNALFRK
jgi:hypothetical protein